MSENCDMPRCIQYALCAPSPGRDGAALGNPVAEDSVTYSVVQHDNGYLDRYYELYLGPDRGEAIATAKEVYKWVLDDYDVIILEFHASNPDERMRANAVESVVQDESYDTGTAPWDMTRGDYMPDNAFGKLKLFPDSYGEAVSDAE